MKALKLLNRELAVVFLLVTIMGCSIEEDRDSTNVEIVIFGDTDISHKVVIQESHVNISLMTEYRDIQELILVENTPKTIEFDHDTRNSYKLVYEGSTRSTQDCESPQERILKIGMDNSVQIDSGCK